MTESDHTHGKDGRLRRLSGWLRQRDPATVFFAAALAIFAANALLSPDPREMIEITPEQAAILLENRTALVGRPLSSEEATRVLSTYVDDEVLVREAVARGLHLSDAKLRARMLAKMDLLLMAEAPEPAAADLEALQAARPDRYSLPRTVSFEHRFFGADEAAASEALTILTEGGEMPDGMARKFWLGNTMEGYSGMQLLSVLGPNSFQSVAGLPQGVWSGPIKTGRGWHVVRLIALTGPQPLPPEELDRRLREDFTVRHLTETRDLRLLDMRKAYDIRLPGNAPAGSSGAALASGAR